MNWNPVPGWPYEASDTGEVRNARTGHTLKQTVHKSGYVNVQLWNKMKFWTVGVHQLVALSFLGPKPSPAHEVRHCDGVKTHNWLANLSYGTALENMADRDAHGTTAVNEKNGKIKHSNEVVAACRNMHAEGTPPREIRAKHKVSVGALSGWVSGRTRPA